MNVKKIFYLFVTVSLLFSMLVPEKRVFAMYPYPSEANHYLQPGESIQALHPVTIDGKQYTIVYYQTESNSDTEGDILYDKTVNRWENTMGITGILVFDGNCPVTNESIIRQILLTELSGYMLTQVADYPRDPKFGTTQGIREQMEWLTGNPLFKTAFAPQNIKDLFDTPKEKYLAAFRNMLVPQGEDAALAKQFALDVQNYIETGSSIKDAVDKALTLSKYSNNRTIRVFAKDMANKLDEVWNIDINTKTAKLSSKGSSSIQVDFSNALKLVNLGITLYTMQELSLERANMLEEIVLAAQAGNIEIETSMLGAMQMAIEEARDTKVQVLDTIYEFVMEQTVDFLLEQTTDVLVKNWATTAFKTFGTRTKGHLVAGVASQLVVGYTISNLLFGMDDVFAASITGIHAAKVEETFYEISLSLKNKYSQNPDDAYEYSYANLYRSTIFFRNIALAQAYRSFAERIEYSFAIKWLADLFTGGGWDEAQVFFEEFAYEKENEIERLVGHPEIIEHAIQLVLERKSMYQADLTPTSATLLVFDVSGSMNEADITGGTKLDAAKSAGERILDIVDSENYATCSSSANVGVIGFSSEAFVHSDLSADASFVRSSLHNLSAYGGTAMPKGLSLAIDQFSTSQNDSFVIILLSDGMPNIGLNNEDDESIIRQQTLDLASNAGDQGICIYTIGFGVPNTIGVVSGNASIDEEFLTEVAERSGCGKYYNAQNAADLANIYINLRHESMGDLLFHEQGQITQDEEVDVGSVQVSAGQEMLLYTLQWPGSQLDPVLFDPSGVRVNQNYPGASISQTASLATIIVQNPLAGRWQMRAVGVDVPEGVLTYNAALSTRSQYVPKRGSAPQRSSGSGGFFIGFVILIVLLSAVLIFTLKVKKSRSSAYLQVVNDPANTRIIPLKDGFVIGRGSPCDLRLADGSVSRQHARLRYAKGAWFIQDLGSAGGTFVNRQRIQAASLNIGDQIKIGQASFSFQQQ